MQNQREYYSNKLAFEIDSADLAAARAARENIILIDTRTASAYSAEHIPGAINIPHRTMSSDATRELDRDALIITYCDGIGCNGSVKGALNMLNLGFRVKELVGGLDWWKRDGHPTHIHAVEQSATMECGCN